MMTNFELQFIQTVKPNISLSTLTKLSADDDWKVRFRVVSNPNISKSTLTVLARDRNLASHRNTDNANKLEETDIGWGQLMGHTPNTPKN